MKKFEVVCICQIYNELNKGNLERFFDSVLPLVNDIVIYDDGSTDGSYNTALKRTPHVIRSLSNDFSNEICHKQLMLTEALKLSPDFILWLDADEVLTAGAYVKLQELCSFCIDNDIDGISMHEINLWRSTSWRRVDSLYDEGWFVRLWKVTPGISFKETGSGLHKQQYPDSIRKIEKTNELEVLHYGFASEMSLAQKYLIYKEHGQKGYLMLDRIINEDSIVLEKVSEELFPAELWVDDSRPPQLTMLEALAYVEKYKSEVFKPRVSIICLIYKSIEWLEFVYEQVYKYTDMTDKEFFFVANDATQTILDYLYKNYIPHYIFENTPEHKSEWYINNVYRAYNFAADKAKGDILVLINSDMAFTPGWFENLWKNYNGSNCIVSRLVEAGKLKSGLYGIEKDFGTDFSNYMENEFLEYVGKISAPRIENSGLYMPLMIGREHFNSVGRYPEGNIVPGSDIFCPEIAKQGEPLVSGDKVLIQKLEASNIHHCTSFDSIVYHFQCGELNSTVSVESLNKSPRVAICNDMITGLNKEKVLWGFMLEHLPESVGIDKFVVGDIGDYTERANEYIRHQYPDVNVIIQNATFIGMVDESKYTIVFLQDDLRSMNRLNKQQERNLQLADKLVTNSIQTAMSYLEYDFEIIPVGVDSDLFRPMDKKQVRTELGFDPSSRIGIFVGSLTEVKGWSEISDCISKYPDIMWIIVSKYKEEYSAPNVRIFTKISQDLLVKLLNCSDFFILGSKVETQCLAAIEACLCDVPVIMHRVGIFKDFSDEDCSKVGIFGDDFVESINAIRNYHLSPREVMIDKKLTVGDSMQRWKALLDQVFAEIHSSKSKRPTGTGELKKQTGLERIRFEINFIIKYKIMKKLFGNYNYTVLEFKQAVKKKLNKHTPSLYRAVYNLWTFLRKVKLCLRGK